MDILLIAFCIIVIFGGFVLIFLGVDNKCYQISAVGGLLLLAMGLLMGGISTYHMRDNIPTAMDVYRGNTTLKVSYVDSVAVDSTVVFKNNK